MWTKTSRGSNSWMRQAMSKSFLSCCLVCSVTGSLLSSCSRDDSVVPVNSEERTFTTGAHTEAEQILPEEGFCESSSRETVLLTSFTRLESARLPNLIRVHPQVYSGGLPIGREAFAELAAMGVRTIVSVDGARPDVELAKAAGLRYVHLPHGYDGISDAQALMLVKAVKELPGPLYIHCHHGKHRSPAAASVACVGAGLMEPGQAVPLLELAGTSPHYRGLYRAAERSRSVAADHLQQLPEDFPEQAVVPQLTAVMVELEHLLDSLLTSAATGWKPTRSDTQLDGPQAALLLREHYTELLRVEEVQQRSPAFLRSLKEAEEHARALEQALLPDSPSSVELSNRSSQAELTLLLNRIQADCKACHLLHRDDLGSTDTPAPR